MILGAEDILAPSDDARRLNHTGSPGARGNGFGAALHLALQVGQAASRNSTRSTRAAKAPPTGSGMDGHRD